MYRYFQCIGSHLSGYFFMQSWIHRPLTYSVSFTEMTRDHIVHVVILTQVQLQQVDLHLTVLDKHAMFNNLEMKEDI